MILPSHYHTHRYFQLGLLHYIHLTAFFSKTTWVSQYQKGKQFWILIKQEMTSGSGISWTICKSFTPHSRQITTLVPHHSVFTGRMPFLPPNQQHQSTATITTITIQKNITFIILHKFLQHTFALLSQTHIILTAMFQVSLLCQVSRYSLTSSILHPVNDYRGTGHPSLISLYFVAFC